MKPKLVIPVLALALCAANTLPTAAAPSLDVQVPIPTTPGEVPGPVPGNTMTKAYVQFIGRMAYVWGYAMVNAHNRREAFRAAPAPGLLGGVVPVAPVGYNAMLTNYVSPEETFIVCPNQDVAYGGGFTELDKEPVVIQVPNFGNRFYVFALYDQRTDEVARIGKQYGTKPGFYMIVGRNWKGQVPKGINGVIRSSTGLVFFVPRVFKDATPEDTAAVQPVINQILMYPLSQFDGKMKTRDYSKLPHFPLPPEPPNAPKGEHGWVKPDTYYEQLPVVLKEVPPLPGEEALYRWIASVWDAAAKNPETKKALVESFIAADEELVKPWFQFQYNGRVVGNGWTVPANASAWGTDYLNRTAVSKSSMYSEHIGGDAIQPARARCGRETVRRQQLLHHHVSKRADPARQGLLVVDALQRPEVLSPESAESILARHEEQDAEIRARRLAHALSRREVAGHRE